MIIEQADELTCRRVAEYEKSQGEAIRHTILEEYGQATSVSDPTSSQKGTSALLHPSEGGTGQAGLMGEGQTPEGHSWWSQLRDPQEDRHLDLRRKGQVTPEALAGSQTICPDTRPLSPH